MTLASWDLLNQFLLLDTQWTNQKILSLKKQIKYVKICKYNLSYSLKWEVTFSEIQQYGWLMLDHKSSLQILYTKLKLVVPDLWTNDPRPKQ